MPQHTALASTFAFLLAVASAAAPAAASNRAQEPGGFRLPPPTTVTGVLETATASHDGATERVWFVATAAGTFLITGSIPEAKGMQKLVGKRVAVEGSLLTEQPGADGTPVPLAGKVGSTRYTGNVMVRDAGAVKPQPVTELTGVVQEVEVAAPTPKEPKRTAKVLQLQCGGEPPVAHAIRPEAAKALKQLLGKTVRVRAFVAGSGEIEAVESATAVEPAK